MNRSARGGLAIHRRKLGFRLAVGRRAPEGRNVATLVRVNGGRSRKGRSGGEIREGGDAGVGGGERARCR